jgi:arylsulfatase A-like enzyme
MGKNWGLRTARYAYVEYAGGYRQLFDVGADPGELRNLAPDPAYAATLLMLHHRLIALRTGRS